MTNPQGEKNPKQLKKIERRYTLTGNSLSNKGFMPKLKISLGELDRPFLAPTTGLPACEVTARPI